MDSQKQALSLYQVVQQHVDQSLQYINISSRDVIRYVSIVGLGFLFGIFFRRYGTLIVSWLLGIILILSILNYFDLVVIQNANIKIALHMEHVHSLDDLILEMKNQVSMHWIDCSLAVVSIIVGFKLG
ncbi:hypothetical protein KBD08_01395 [Candidatus Babeliales bacterium]|nr:hypothetical protein [Candidatus Babeliales bacterium]